MFGRDPHGSTVGLDAARRPFEGLARAAGTDVRFNPAGHGHESITTTARNCLHLYEDNLDRGGARPNQPNGGRLTLTRPKPATKAWSRSKKTPVLMASVTLTWASALSRLSESNRRPNHYE